MSPDRDIAAIVREAFEAGFVKGCGGTLTQPSDRDLEYLKLWADAHVRLVLDQLGARAR